VIITGGVHDMTDIDFSEDARERIEAVRPGLAAEFEKVGFTVQPAPVEDLSDAWKPEARWRLMRNLAQEFLARTYYRLAGYL
jgi:hypothetical protein